MNKPDDLSRDLELAGASHEELPQLLTLADRLRHLPCPSYKSKALWRWSWPRLAAIWAGTSCATLLVGGSMVAAAQTSTPNTPLYPLKRASEHVAVMVDPDFYEAVMRHRATEINELTLRHASEDDVMKDIHDYMNVLSVHPRVDSATRDYCAENLEQAIRHSDGPEQLALKSALQRMSYQK